MNPANQKSFEEAMKANWVPSASPKLDRLTNRQVGIGFIFAFVLGAFFKGGWHAPNWAMGSCCLLSHACFSLLQDGSFVFLKDRLRNIRLSPCS